MYRRYSLKHVNLSARCKRFVGANDQKQNEWYCCFWFRDVIRAKKICAQGWRIVVGSSAISRRFVDFASAAISSRRHSLPVSGKLRIAHLYADLYPRGAQLVHGTAFAPAKSLSAASGSEKRLYKVRAGFCINWRPSRCRIRLRFTEIYRRCLITSLRRSRLRRRNKRYHRNAPRSAVCMAAPGYLSALPPQIAFAIKNFLQEPGFKQRPAGFTPSVVILTRPTGACAPFITVLEFNGQVADISSMA